MVMKDNKNLVFQIKYLKKKKYVKELFSKIRDKIKYNEDRMQPEIEDWGMNVNKKTKEFEVD